MQTQKEMTEQVKEIFKRLFSDVKEVANAGAQGQEVWLTYVQSKINTLTLEEQEVRLRYFFSSKLETMLIDFAKIFVGFGGGKPL